MLNLVILIRYLIFSNLKCNNTEQCSKYKKAEFVGCNNTIFYVENENTVNFRENTISQFDHKWDRTKYPVCNEVKYNQAHSKK